MTTSLQTALNAKLNISSGISILQTTTSINAKTVANTSIFTVPAGKTAIITGIIIRCTAASSITVGPTIGIGSASGTNDIIAPEAILALIATSGSGSLFGFPVAGMSVQASGGQIYLNLTNASTGTSQVIAVDLLGYLV